MSNWDVGDYKGRIGLSPPAVYPSTVRNEVNKGSL
jgi:acyl-homoserine lactone acylase PvdQ